jgi:hypothetical protein
MRTMLTAILLAYDDPARPMRRDAVARSLASLVEACVRGLVADAVLVGAPGSRLDRIADEAGCALVEAAGREDGLAQALDVARQDAAFVLLAGNAIERGFLDELDDAFAYGEGGRRAFVLRAAPASLMTRLAPSLAAPVGLIAPKGALRAAGSGDLRKLAKKIRCAELKSSARQTF